MKPRTDILIVVSWLMAAPMAVTAQGTPPVLAPSPLQTATRLAANLPAPSTLAASGASAISPAKPSTAPKPAPVNPALPEEVRPTPAADVKTHAVWTRDPFQAPAPPPTSAQATAMQPGGKPAIERPAGLAGMLLQEIKIEGIILGGPGGPVALLGGSQKNTYVLHPGARIYDASIVRIAGNGVWFKRMLPSNDPGSAGAPGEEVFVKVN